MNSRDSVQFWSISCGTWFRTQVRLSVYLFPLLLALCFHLGSWKLGLVFGALLIVALLVHEFGHIVGVRLTGGSGNEILVWPLGGLATIQPADTFASRFLTAAAGPLVNLAVCAVTFWPVWTSGLLREALHPLLLPSVRLEGTVLRDLFVLLFHANWVLFLVNLIPVFPLDGGRMLQACLRTRVGAESALELSIRVGYFAAFAAMIAGLMVSSPWLVFLGAILFIFNMLEGMQVRPADGYDDSFMGYDFSQGYTSLERSREAPRVHRPGFFERWRARRRAEKLRRAQLRDEQEQQQLDALLAKVHASGIESLSDAERRKLHRASTRLRGKGKHQS